MKATDEQIAVVENTRDNWRQQMWAAEQRSKLFRCGDMEAGWQKVYALTAVLDELRGLREREAVMIEEPPDGCPYCGSVECQSDHK